MPVVVRNSAYANTSGATTPVLVSPETRLLFDRPRSQTVSQPIRGISGIQDDFNDGVLNTSLWATSYGTYGEANGRAFVQSAAQSYSGIQSRLIYTFDRFSIRVFPAPMADTMYGYTGVWFTTTEAAAGTDVGFIHEPVPNMLSFRTRVSYDDPTAVNITYDPVAHAYWRLRVDGASLIWETSPNAQTWTIQRTITTPTWLSGSSTTKVLLESYRSTGTTQVAEFENANITNPYDTYYGQTSMASASTLTAGALLETPSQTSMSSVSSFGSAATLALPAASGMASSSDFSASAVRATPATTAMASSSSLAVAGIRTTTTAASLTSASSLAGASSRLTTAAADFTSASTIAASPIATTPATALLASASTLTASGVATATSSTWLTSLSSMTAASAQGLVASAGLSSASVMTAAVYVVTPAGAAFQATSQLSTAAQVVAQAGALMSVASMLNASGLRTTAGASQLSSSSSVAASSLRTTYGAASWSSLSQLVAAGVRVLDVQTSLAAESGLAAEFQLTAQAETFLVAQSELAVNATRVVLSVSSLASASSLGVMATRGVAVAAMLTGFSDFDMLPQISQPGAADMDAVSEVILELGREKTAFATLSSESEFDAEIIRTSEAGVIMAAGTALLADGRRTTRVTTTFIGVSTLPAKATQREIAQVGFWVSSEFDPGTPSQNGSGGVSLSGASDLVATMYRGRFGRSTFSSVSALTLGARSEYSASVVLAALSSMTSNGVRRADLLVTFSAATQLLANGEKKLLGDAALTVSSGWTAAALQIQLSRAALISQSAMSVQVDNDRALRSFMQSFSSLYAEAVIFPLVFAARHQVIPRMPPSGITQGGSQSGVVLTEGGSA